MLLLFIGKTENHIIDLNRVKYYTVLNSVKVYTVE